MNNVIDFDSAEVYEIEDAELIDADDDSILILTNQDSTVVETLETESVVNLARIEAADSVDEILSLLDPQSRKILKLRYGIGCDPLNIEETRVELGLERRGQVRNLESNALRTLQNIVQDQPNLL